MIEETGNYKHLQRAVFCKNCSGVDIRTLQVKCILNKCAYNQIELTTIFDLYSNLYFMLDNQNITYYYTLLQSGVEDHPKRLQIRRLWDTHTQKKPYKYDTFLCRTLKKETYNIISENLLSSVNPNDFLLCLASWLFVLDEHLGILKQSIGHQVNPEFPIETVRGQLINKNSTTIISYLCENYEIQPTVNTDYLILRNNIKNFHLVNSCYPYYPIIKHKFLKPVDSLLHETTIEDIQIGFLPGTANIEDNKLEVSSGNNQGEKFFYFNGLYDQENYYSEKIKNQFLRILQKNPQFIILPELFTPLYIQNRLIEILQEKRKRRRQEGKEHKVVLLIPGSYHEHISNIFPESITDRIYNYSLVTTGYGKKLLDVFKMNMFKFPSNPSYTGSLKEFTSHSGVEKNAYDLNEITFIETPLGRIAVFICIDFINEKVEDILRDRHVDIIFVMSFTKNPSGGHFLRTIQTLGDKNSSIIIVCNNASIFGENVDRIVVYFPGLPVYTSKESMEVINIGQVVDLIKNFSGRV